MDIDPRVIQELHEKSGLTWEQLGRLSGVSRRAEALGSIRVASCDAIVTGAS